MVPCTLERVDCGPAWMLWHCYTCAHYLGAAQEITSRLTIPFRWDSPASKLRDAPPPLADCALIHSAIRKNKPTVRGGPASPTSVHNRDNAASRPAAARNLGISSEEV